MELNFSIGRTARLPARVRPRAVSAVMRVFACGAVMIAAAASADPNAELSTTQIDLGVIEQGQVVDVPLSIRNTGDAPLTIEKIQFSCHCVSARELTADEKTVPPGGERALPITYDPMSYLGSREALIVIRTNDPDEPALQARLTTTIVAPVVMTPRVLRWGPTVKGSTLEAEIRVKPGVADSELELLSIEVPHPDLEFTRSISEQDGEIVIDAAFKIADSARIGELNTVIEAQVQLADRQFPVRTPLSLYVMGDVVVRPPQIVSINRPLQPGEQISTITLLWTQPERPIDLLDTKTTGPIRASTRQLPDRFEIDVFVLADAEPGPQSGQVDLFSTSGDQPVTVVPIYFLVGSGVVVEPAAVALEVADGTAAADVTLRVPDGAVAISGVHSDVEGVTASLVDDAAGKDGTVVAVRYQGEADALPKTGYLTVDAKSAPPVRVPVVVRASPEGNTKP